MYTGVYVVRARITAVTAAKTLIQLKAAAGLSLELLRASVTNGSVEASDTMEIQIVRKTVVSTVTAFTPLLTNKGFQPAKSIGGVSATGVNASTEGTDGDILDQEGVNVLQGYRQAWLPEERIHVEAAATIALKLANTIASTTLIAILVFGEKG